MNLVNLGELANVPCLKELRRSPLTVVFRLVLLMSLWHAPIPCRHLHHGVTASVAQHVSEFHHGDTAACEMGWHWHLMMPDGSQQASNTAGGSNTSKSSANPSQTYGIVTATCLSDVVIVPTMLVTPLVQLTTPSLPHDCRPAVHGFFATYSLSPQQLLGRARC